MMCFPIFAYLNPTPEAPMPALSKNFDLTEFTISQTAARSGIDNTPSHADAANLKRLVTTVLQPLRDKLGKPISISSGYRSPLLNRAIGGSPTSAHMAGRAADIHVPGLTVAQVMKAVRDLKLPVDQVIDEFGQWLHVGIATTGAQPRNQYLLARYNGGQTVYSEAPR